MSLRSLIRMASILISLFASFNAFADFSPSPTGLGLVLGQKMTRAEVPAFARARWPQRDVHDGGWVENRYFYCAIGKGFPASNCPTPILGCNYWYGACYILDWLPLRDICPAHSLTVGGGCRCDSGYQEDGAQTACIPATPEPQSCRIDGQSTATPIFPATAEKYRSETDWSDSGPRCFFFTRTYRSNWAGDPTQPTTHSVKSGRTTSAPSWSPRPALLLWASPSRPVKGMCGLSASWRAPPPGPPAIAPIL